MSDLSQPEARQTVICVMNVARAAMGLAALSESPELSLAAQRHSDDMFARGYVEHEAPAPAPFGDSARERGLAAGFGGEPAGEILARGSSTPYDVTEAWLNSPKGHCLGVMRPSTDVAGFGISDANGAELWTGMFGRTRPAVSEAANDSSPYCGDNRPTVYEMVGDGDGGTRRLVAPKPGETVKTGVVLGKPRWMASQQWTLKVTLKRVGDTQKVVKTRYRAKKVCRKGGKGCKIVRGKRLDTTDWLGGSGIDAVSVPRAKYAQVVVVKAVAGTYDGTKYGAAQASVTVPKR